VDRRAGIPRVDFTPVRTVRISGAALTAGIEEHDIEGVQVRVTSPARTVVDCFKFRHKIGIDVAVDAIRETTAACGRALSTSCASTRNAVLAAHREAVRLL
jgi:predicted transcriptional regulator of viral defense system